jgi:seryl-tRNA synthetase
MHKRFTFAPQNFKMLTLQLLRTETEKVREGLRKKHFADIQLVDGILAMDEKRRQIQLQNDNLLAQLNAAAKQIGGLMQTGKKEEAEQIKLQVAEWKKQSEQLKTDLENTEKAQHDLLVRLPNMPHASVPNGKTPEENEVVFQVATIPTLPEDALPHWELTTKYNLIDFELGVKLTGAGFPVYKGKGAKLQRALIAYFLDKAIDAGYNEVIPPLMVNAASGYGTGQLPDKEGQMYHATVDDFYLIPTAEVPVTNIYRDTILKEEDLLKLKKAIKLKCFNKNLLIHTDNEKNIIITLYSKNFLDKKNSYSLKTNYKSKNDLFLSKDKVVYKINNISKIAILSPIVIPPTDEYEVTIFLKENHLEMKSKKMKFLFPLDEIPLTTTENHLPNQNA